MPTDLIRYDLLVQDALKSVVRSVLMDAARDGLPGDHHFCITFRTQAPGVRLSSRVREKHPEELTIILQHQFWDLVVTTQAFDVGLSFGGITERLSVPFDAVTGFWDPFVQFGLKFEVQDFSPEASANDASPAEPAPSAIALLGKEEPGPSQKSDGARPKESEPTEIAPLGVKNKASKQDAVPPSGEKTGSESASNASDKVVSIDAFRKKP